MDETTETPVTAEAEEALEEGAKDASGSFTRLAGKGQEKIKQTAGDLGSAAAGSQPVTAARDIFEQASRSLMTQFHVATTDGLDELRGQIADLEERLAALEGKKRPAAAKEAKDGAAEG